jgi:hypothetical protein
MSIRSYSVEFAQTSLRDKPAALISLRSLETDHPVLSPDFTIR